MRADEHHHAQRYPSEEIVRALAESGREVRSIVVSIKSHSCDHLCEEEIKLANSIAKLYDATDPLKDLVVDDVIEWDLKTRLALCGIREALRELANGVGLEWLLTEPAERHRLWSERENEWKESVERPFYDAARSFAKGFTLARSIDIVLRHAEQAEAKGYRATLTPEEGEARYVNLRDAWISTNCLGTVPYDDQERGNLDNPTLRVFSDAISILENALARLPRQTLLSQAETAQDDRLAKITRPSRQRVEALVNELVAFVSRVPTIIKSVVNARTFLLANAELERLVIAVDAAITGLEPADENEQSQEWDHLVLQAIHAIPTYFKRIVIRGSEGSWGYERDPETNRLFLPKSAFGRIDNHSPNQLTPQVQKGLEDLSAAIETIKSATTSSRNPNRVHPIEPDTGTPEAREKLVEEYLRNHPTDTSAQVASATKIPVGSIRRLDAWKKHRQSRLAQSRWQRTLTPETLAARGSTESDPTDYAAKREIFDFVCKEPELAAELYLDNASDADRRKYEMANPEHQQEILLWYHLNQK